ncbi:hypothetical protein Droror1_Dr00005764 [Drosera rotundifolia]
MIMWRGGKRGEAVAVVPLRNWIRTKKENLYPSSTFSSSATASAPPSSPLSSPPPPHTSPPLLIPQPSPSHHRRQPPHQKPSLRNHDLPRPYCSATSSRRCATTISDRPITNCAACGRAILEHQTLTQHHHHLFHLRVIDSPLLLSTSNLPTPPSSSLFNSNFDFDSDSDPFNPIGFITAFSKLSLTRTPVYVVSSVSFSGHLAELDRALEGSVYFNFDVDLD